MKRLCAKTSIALVLFTAAAMVYWGLYHISLYGFDLFMPTKRKHKSAGNHYRHFCVCDDGSIHAYKTEFIV